MKKRIISLILVIVMACLVLISCGYSYSKDDMSQYVTFTDADLAAFKEALGKLNIEDGDYTQDAEVRAKKVIDSIYSELASVAKNGEKKTEGALGEHDLFYYNYYCTAEFDGQTVTFYTSSMKSDSAANVQLGMQDASEIASLIGAAIAGVDIKDKVYSSEATGSVREGDVVFVSYTVSQKVEVKDENGNVQKDENGNPVTKEEKTTVTNERIVLVKDSSLLVNHLLGVTAEGEEKKSPATINTKVDDFTTANGVGYTGIKVNWRGNGEAITSVKYTPYTEERKVTDTNGVSRDLKDKEVTYYIYPAYYYSVEELNALNLINSIFGADITAEGVVGVIVDGYVDMTEDEKKAALDGFNTTGADGKTVTLEDICKKLATLQGDLDKAKTAYDKAVEDLEKAQSNYDDAKAKVDAAGDAATDAQKDTLTKASEKLETAKKAGDDAKKKYDDALLARDGKVTELLSVKEGMETLLVEGYKRTTHEYLLGVYNNEIKMNLAKEVYALLEKHITVNSVPEKAAELTYEQLWENYEHSFYNDYYDSDKKITNYKQYEGHFEEFFIDKITTDIKKVTTLDEAKAALKEKAEEINKPIVRIYALSEAYGVKLTEDEIEELKENDNTYYQDEYQYGETSVLNAYQFDKLMNTILEREENEDGSYTYKNVVFTIGEAEEKTEDESAE